MDELEKALMELRTASEAVKTASEAEKVVKQKVQALMKATAQDVASSSGIECRFALAKKPKTSPESYNWFDAESRLVAMRRKAEAERFLEDCVIEGKAELLTTSRFVVKLS